MSFESLLRDVFEQAENETVGPAFGGSNPALRKNFSVTSVRDWIILQKPYPGTTGIEQALLSLYGLLSVSRFSTVVAALIRFSFLIELTNLTVGSTKMKTRWLPGLILMPQPNSFEPIRGTFQPGNDPRAASFDECAQVFVAGSKLIRDAVAKDATMTDTIDLLKTHRRVPYEFPLSYRDAALAPVHVAANVKWALNDDILWLLKARKILASATGTDRNAIRELEKRKLEVKVYKTDRALTGKDKTNRAKRWEVLSGDFQHATLEQCWSAERKLTNDLVCFHDFPQPVRQQFISQGLIPKAFDASRCPVTLEPLSYKSLAASLLSPTHGLSEYQIGHLHPLKRHGRHDGSNVCWQSANGNRIQGDLSIEETEELLAAIANRRAQLGVTN